MKAQTKNRRLTGNFETMEDRQLFAADLMMNAGIAMATEAPVERATFEVAESSSVLDQIVAEGLPNPDDDDSPVGPRFSDVGQIQDATLGSIGDGLIKPNPEDDDSPVGPLTQAAAERIQNVAKPMDIHLGGIAEAELMSLQSEETGDGGESEGKPDVDPDCDGNPLTASCDLTAEVPFEHANPEPDVDPDCDGNPLTASCDLTAEVPFEHAKPEPDPECDEILGSCDRTDKPTEENETNDQLLELLQEDRELLTLEEESKKEVTFPGDTDGDFDVDFSDFLQVSNNYGMTGATRSQGDLTGDGNVNFADFLQVSNNYGNDLAELLDRADIVDLLFAKI